MYIYILMTVTGEFSRVLMNGEKFMSDNFGFDWKESTICKSGAVWRQWDNGYWHLIETKVTNPFME